MATEVLRSRLLIDGEPAGWRGGAKLGETTSYCSELRDTCDEALVDAQQSLDFLQHAMSYEVF